jgi:DNA-directed RNA polymerase specialized sigma24 family protein
LLVRELAQLSEGERVALLLRSEGFSYEEIAQRLQVTLSAAKVRVHRARVKLQSRRTDP